MADRLLSFATEDAGEVGVAIETPRRGPVDESLIERGFAVHSINPKQLERFREPICGFRGKPITDSGRNRSLIPIQADH